jgi:ADP-ribose pyrophosphatase
VTRPAASLEWQGKYLEVRKAGTWEFAARVGNMGAAVILAVTDAAEIVLVEQFRAAHGRPSLELPAGLIGDTDAGDTAAMAAARELHEETGFEASVWEDIGSFATSPGMSSESFTLFKATGLARTAAGGGVDHEDITVHVVPLAGIAAFIAGQRRAGHVIDCRLIVALGLL